MSLGYINVQNSFEDLDKKTFFIEVEKKKYEAVLEINSLHDPDNKILKS